MIMVQTNMKRLLCLISLLSISLITHAEEALLVAARMGDLEAISKLAKDKTALNKKSRIGLTPWQVAMINRRTEAADLLKKLGADSEAEFPAPEQSLDAWLSSMVDPNGPGTMVRISQDGKVLFEKGYGLASLDPKHSITPETKFRIGSVTKQMTASVILKFIEEGKLTTETKLSKFYPDFPRADEVTIHHLLTHSSGIKSMTDRPGFVDHMHKPATAQEMIDSVKNEPYDFDPGTRFLYNNTGYYLLGEIAAKLHGKPFPDVMQDVLFKPCGMADSGVHREDLQLAHESRGYSHIDGKTDLARKWDMTRADGAGAVYSTVGDLDRWNEAIFTKGFLKPETLKQAFTIWPTQEDPKPETGYGYGWCISEWNGLKMINHSGGLPGWASFLVRFTEEKFTIVILSNSEMQSVPGTAPGQIEEAIAHFYLWRKMSANNPPKIDPKVDRSKFEIYTGRYDYGGSIMTVSKREERLFARLAGQSEYEIFPKEGSTFFWRIVPAEVTFEVDHLSKVTHAIHKQGGRTTRAKKLKELSLVKLTSEELQAVAGKYLLAPKVFITVTQEKDQLFAQITGQLKCPIHPSSPSVFHYSDVDATLEFEIARGAATGGKLLQNGGTIPLVREKN